MQQELFKIYDILSSFLGEAKGGYDGTETQLQFPCPCCIDKYGKSESRKYNLEVNIGGRQVFQCWKCASEGEPMHGSIKKLIRMYGNENAYRDYKVAIASIRQSELYKLNFSENDFNIATQTSTEDTSIKFPESFQFFEQGKPFPARAMKYLKERGIGWDIINKYKLGFTGFQEEDKKSSFRIIIPSYDAFGDINYWTGRDYLNNEKRMKYDNPKVEKKGLIFNEEKIQWDADITLVEGPFDHLVVPNSVPMLGKALSQDYKLYWELVTRANANVQIFLDGDARETAKETYKLLNHGRLYGKIRYVPVANDLDPSLIYQLYGKKGIIKHLANSIKINEVFL